MSADFMLRVLQFVLVDFQGFPKPVGSSTQHECDMEPLGKPHRVRRQSRSCRAIQASAGCNSVVELLVLSFIDLIGRPRCHRIRSPRKPLSQCNGVVHVETSHGDTVPLGSYICRKCSNNLATSCGFRPVRCVCSHALPRYQRAGEAKERGKPFNHYGFGDNQRTIQQSWNEF